MIGVVVPAHNEEGQLSACLTAIAQAAMHPELGGEEVCVVVVLDSCTDGSARIATSLGALTLRVAACNVGIARATGAGQLIEAGARWLAFTDADTIVSAHWLAAQLAFGADAVCGSVALTDWSQHAQQVRQALDTGIFENAGGHRRIHGANFGVSAQVYQRAGGFSPLVSSGNTALMQALIAAGARIAWSGLPHVSTSARVDTRVLDGSGSHLLSTAEPGVS